MGLGHIAVGMECGLIAGEIGFRLGLGDGGIRRRFVLACGETIKVGARSVVPAKNIAGGSDAPAQQRRRLRRELPGVTR